MSSRLPCLFDVTKTLDAAAHELISGIAPHLCMETGESQLKWIGMFAVITPLTMWVSSCGAKRTHLEKQMPDF